MWDYEKTKGEVTVKKTKKMCILFIVVGLSSILTACLVTVWASNKSTEDPNQARQQDSGSQPEEKPMIIWFHNGATYSTLSLKTAISSGLITHVMLLYMHRADRDWKANRDVQEAIKIVKKSDAKLIWCRCLWVLYAIENSKHSDLFDPLYYIQEIQNLRAEAKEMGADFVALDAEPYGHSPMKYYLFGNRLDGQQKEQLKLAVRRAVGVVGKVDFIRPGGSANRGGPAEILAKLGKYRFSGISKSVNALKHKPPYEVYPYEIFAAYLNTFKKDTGEPQFTYFLVPEIFENSHIWSDKEGLLLYPREKNTLAVARELVTYARGLPIMNRKQNQKPDSSR